MGPNSPAAAPPRSFFKIILPSIIKDHKLRIPEDFAKKYERELSSYAKLIVPNGSVFCVQVEKAEKMLWLNNGWKEFAEHHSIRCGFLLVFDCIGNSEFMVHIFDLTATEIKYPKKALVTCEEPEKGKKKSGVRSRPSHLSISRTKPVSAEDKIFEECLQPGSKRKVCIHSMLPKLLDLAPEFATSINKFGKCISNSFLNSYSTMGTYKTRNKRSKVDNVSETMTILKNVCPCKDTTKAIVGFNSCIESENDKLNAENLDENVRISDESGLQNLTLGADKKGQQFVEDSKDVHLATQINKDEDPVKVKKGEGERLNGVNNSSISPKMPRIQDKQKAINTALMLKLKNPYFMIILKQYNVGDSCILHVPVYFGKIYLSRDTKYLTLEEGLEGKQWKVSCFANGEVQYLGQEWVEFVNDNNLSEGDVCIFELIQANDLVLKVHIFRTFQASV